MLVNCSMYHPDLPCLLNLIFLWTEIAITSFTLINIYLHTSDEFLAHLRQQHKVSHHFCLREENKLTIKYQVSKLESKLIHETFSLF